MKIPKVTIDYSKCTSCKTCIEVCPMQVFAEKDKKVVVAKEKDCIGCHACEVQCPHEAITVEDD